MEDKELKVLASKVREAGRTCPTTKKALQTIFPEAFAEEKIQSGELFNDEWGNVFVVAVTGGIHPGKSYKPTVRLINVSTGMKFKEGPVAYDAYKREGEVFFFTLSDPDDFFFSDVNLERIGKGFRLSLVKEGE